MNVGCDDEPYCHFYWVAERVVTASSGMADSDRCPFRDQLDDFHRHLRWIVARLLFRARDFSSVLSDKSAQSYSVVRDLRLVVHHRILESSRQTFDLVAAWRHHCICHRNEPRAFRTSQLFQGQHQHRVGESVSCTLEWGWLFDGPCGLSTCSYRGH